MTPETPEPAQASPPDAAPRAGNRARKAALAVVIVALLVAGVAALRWALEPAHPPLWGLLPAGAEVYVHADLAALRGNPAVAWYLNDGPGLPGAKESREPSGEAENETRRFIEATGFRYQEHLHQLAAARKDGQWTGAARITMDRQRFESYLRQRATRVDQLAASPVYAFGEVRPLKIVLASDTELAFSIGPGDDGLAQTLLMLAQPPEASAAVKSLAQQLPAAAAARWRAVQGHALWVVGDAAKLLAPAAGDEAPPSFGGFMLGEETLAGVESLLASLDSGALNFGIDGELICKPGVSPKPLADNLTLLASLLRPRAPEPGARDLRPVWDALSISSTESSVLLRWRPTPQMLSLLTADGKP